MSMRENYARTLRQLVRELRTNAPAGEWQTIFRIAQRVLGISTSRLQKLRRNLDGILQSNQLYSYSRQVAVSSRRHQSALPRAIDCCTSSRLQFQPSFHFNGLDCDLIVNRIRSWIVLRLCWRVWVTTRWEVVRGRKWSLSGAFS